MDEYYRTVRVLPVWLAEPLEQLPTSLARQVHELRLRTGCGIVLTIQGQQCAAESLPECPDALRGIRLTSVQIEGIFYALCGGSVHTHQSELEQGFLTTPCGCRVGVAGRFANRNGQLILQQITSLDLRIARVIPAVLPDNLRCILQGHFVGLLVVGEPDSGKTTLLRQIAAELASQHCSTAVVDERGELFAPQNNPCEGSLDVLSGVPKAQGIQMALRTLSPRVIVLDELGTLEETRALEQGFFSGVDFAASVHGTTEEEVLRRPQVRYLRQQGMLRVLVLLHGRRAPGVIREIRVLE